MDNFEGCTFLLLYTTGAIVVLILGILYYVYW